MKKLILLALFMVVNWAYAQTSDSTAKGVIEGIDIESGIVILNNVQYRLADRLQIRDSESLNSVDRGHLRKGYFIEASLNSAGEISSIYLLSSLPKKIIQY